MKTIVLVLVAALALVGAAAAWSNTDTLSIVGGKTTYIQAGDPVASFAGFTSYGGFEDNNMVTGKIDPWETEGSLAMQAVKAGDNPVDVQGASPSQTDTLTQIGSVKVVTEAPDTQDGKAEQDASFSTYQNMNFCGAVYKPGASGLGGDRGADMVWADFASEGSVGVNDFEVGSTLVKETTVVPYDAIGAIEGTSAASITGADIGVASKTGFTGTEMADGSIQHLLSGSATAFSDFTGGVLGPGANQFIQANTGKYENTVSTNANMGIVDFPDVGKEGAEFPTGYPDW